MRFLFLILFFQGLLCLVEFGDIFPVKKYIAVENLEGRNMENVDVPIEIDTRSLIEEDKLVDCSYLRFRAADTFCNFFIESSCGTTHTLIWVHLDVLNISGLNITMYYGIDDYSKIDSTGLELTWESEFLVLTDGTCGDWRDYTVDRMRFLRISNTFAETNAVSQIEDHRHRFYGDTSDADSRDECLVDSCVGEVGWVAKDRHIHSFDYDTNYAEGLPPYQSIKMCEKRYLDLQKDFVLAYNGTDFGYDGMSRFNGFNDRFAVIYDDDSLVGGQSQHFHDITGKSIVDILTLEIYATKGEVTSPAQANYIHSHTGVFANFSTLSNIPTSFEIPFAKLSENETDFLPYLFFAKSLPPLGFLQSSLDGRYVRDGSSYGGFTTGVAGDHTLSDQNIGSSGETWDYCNDFPAGPYCALNGHQHTFDEPDYTIEIDGGGTWDVDDKNRLDVLGVFRKAVVTSTIVGPELVNKMCFEYDYQDVGVCGGHGVCEATDICLCNTTSPVYYFGVECEIWFCDDKSNTNPDVCSNKGDCSDYNLCDCENGYDGTWCEWTCDGIQYDDISSEDIICSGHGVCVDIDTCNCTAGNYSGDLCEEWYCFDYVNTDNSHVCSGNGDCVDYDDCDCKGGYTGKICQGKIGHASFSDDGTTITLEYRSSTKYFSSNEIPVDNDIKKYFPCSTKVDNYEILGKKPFCYFTLNSHMNETTMLTILVGKNPTITDASTLHVIDSGGKSYPRSVSLPSDPKVPRVTLKKDVEYCVTNKTLLSSYSDNVRDLDFLWTVSAYPEGGLYLTSNEKFFRMEEYGDMKKNSKYVVYVQASNFMGGYAVDYLICKVPEETFEKSSAFESGSTYGYVSFFCLFVFGFLLLILSCFVCFFCFCWNALQLDVIQDRLFGIQLLIEDIGIARKKQKLRMYRMTMMQVDGMDDEEWEDYESELKDFARRSVNISRPNTPSSTTELLEGRTVEDIPATPIPPESPSSSTQLLRKEMEDDFNVINDKDDDDSSEKEVDSQKKKLPPKPLKKKAIPPTPPKGRPNLPKKNVPPKPPKGRPTLPKKEKPKTPMKKRNLFESDSDSGSDSDKERKSHHTFQSFVNEFNEED